MDWLSKPMPQAALGLVLHAYSPVLFPPERNVVAGVAGEKWLALVSGLQTCVLHVPFQDFSQK